MKFWMMTLALAAVLGFGNFAQAVNAGKHGHGHGHGLHGKIESVGTNSFTMTTGGKKNPHTLTINFDANTVIMIDGVKGTLDASVVGKHATIAGSANGDTVAATAVTVSTKSHHKKKDAA